MNWKTTLGSICGLIAFIGMKLIIKESLFSTLANTFAILVWVVLWLVVSTIGDEESLASAVTTTLILTFMSVITGV